MGATTTHYASFLTLGGVGGWAREAGGGETSVGDEGWVRERGRSGRGGQLSFWGMKGVPGRE